MAPHISLHIALHISLDIALHMARRMARRMAPHIARASSGRRVLRKTRPLLLAATLARWRLP